MEAFPLTQPGTSDEPFSLCPPANKITLHHLLLHTSGLSHHGVSLVSKYFVSDHEKLVFKEDAPFIVKNFSIPLIFEPGEGFAYGYSIHWTQTLITRLTGIFLDYVQEHIFNPLGMASFIYRPRDNPDIWNRRLKMVEREGGKLVPADDATQGLMCSISDITAILSDLILPSPTLFKQEYINLLFTGQFAPSSTALRDLRSNHDNHAFYAGMLGSAGYPLVNWSEGGLVVQEKLPVSCMLKGTLTWEGVPNVLWAMNREKGLAMFFATQLIPVGDKIANGFATTFMRDAWNHFG